MTRHYHRRLERSSQDHNYTSFISLAEVEKEEESTGKSLILAQCLLGEIKQKQSESLCRDVSADKDLSMAHFHGT